MAVFEDCQATTLTTRPPWPGSKTPLFWENPNFKSKFNFWGAPYEFLVSICVSQSSAWEPQRRVWEPQRRGWEPHIVTAIHRYFVGILQYK